MANDEPTPRRRSRSQTPMNEVQLRREQLVLAELKQLVLAELFLAILTHPEEVVAVCDAVDAHIATTMEVLNG